MDKIGTDVAGRRVRVLADGLYGAGVHRVSWEGADDAGRPVGAGVYFYRLQYGSREEGRRVVVAR